MDEERKQPIADTPELSDTASSAEEQAALPPDGETADEENVVCRDTQDDEEVFLPLSARREREEYLSAQEKEPAATSDSTDSEDDDDDISLPLSAAREDYRRLSKKDPIIEEQQEEEDEEVSLPLSARRDDGDKGYSAPARVVPPQPQPVYREIPQANNITARSLMECAMMVAISLVLALIGFYVPVANIIGLLLFPLPLAVLVFRNGVKTGLIGAIALFALAAIFFGLPNAVIMMIEYGILCIFLGYCFRKQKGPLFTMGFAIVIAACGTLVGLMLSLFISGLPFSAMTEEMTQFAHEYFSMFSGSGLDAFIPGGMTMDAFIQEMTDWMIRLIPALLIIGSMIMAAVGYGVSAKILRHLRYDIPKVPPFSEWRMDWKFSWGVIAGLAFTLAGNYFEISWMNTLGWNILYVFCPVLLVCGLAFVVWLFKQPIYSPMLKTLLVLMMIFFFQATFFLLMVLAVFEPIIDFRGRLKKAMEKMKR